MLNKKLLISILIVVFLIQWYVPASMILEREKVLRSGKVFKIRTAPVDPNDPFRGKYVSLSFLRNRFPASPVIKKEFNPGDPVYLVPAIDKEGFFVIDTILKKPPQDQNDYMEVTFAYWGEDGQDMVFNYPFDRYYMEEYKAPRAEQTYSSAMKDTSAKTYALVRVWKGDAVIQDVLINDSSLTDLVKEKE